MPQLDAVLFDLDGVLIDSYSLWFQLMNDATRALNFPPISEQRFHETWGQGIDADIQAFFPGTTPAVLARHFSAHYGDFLNQLKRIEGAEEAITSLKYAPTQSGSRKKIGVVTNSLGGLARRALETVVLYNHVDRVLGADEAGAAKPDPIGIRKICRQLGVQPSAALMVGDSMYDEQAAKAAGVHFVGFRLKSHFHINAFKELRPWVEWFEST